MSNLEKHYMKADTNFPNQSLEDVLNYNIRVVEDQIESIKIRLREGKIEATDEVLDVLNDLDGRHDMLTATLLQIDYIQIIPVESDEML